MVVLFILLIIVGASFY
ncbi:YjcZ family sporulation protein [Oceanobacillus piezotolerans]|uniref:YjcZ family sporulation protein n=1 Tax=Oceanobacillus piezotolerans TaxID=2448030 RepID=A0A498DBJ6_9BACI|nr:YjcZ family sporulation protein [Oceanobacillus piezotolerans]